ncbi:MAG: AEC family transporter [Acetatifactor sp.]
MYSELFQLMGMMFLMMGAGFFLKKGKLISDAGKKGIVNLILYVVLPCNIVNAFSMKLEENFWVGFSQALIVATAIQVLCMILAKTLYNRMPKGEKQVFQYATVCSNAGFMGNPLAQGVFGDLGLLYASVFLIPQRIVMWTAGVSYFTENGDKKTAVKKVLVHPCMIAVYIGMVIMVFQLKLPDVLSNTVKSFSSCCTAMTMLYIGTVLADVKFRELCSKKQVYFMLIRLILIPTVVFAACLLAHVDTLVMGVCVLLTATPAGSTTSILASKYGADEEAAAKCVVFTTALSVITIPIWSAILINCL